MSDQITIIRASKDKDNPYVMVRKSVTQDENLSWEARGVLVYLLGKPDDWKVSPVDLQQQCGKAKVYRILNDLIAAGYIKRDTVKDEHNRIVEWIYYVYELPQTIKDEPLTENQEMAQPEMENRDSTNKRSLPSNDGSKKNFTPPKNGDVQTVADAGGSIGRSNGDVAESPASVSLVAYDRPAAPGNISDKQWEDVSRAYKLGAAIHTMPIPQAISKYKKVVNELATAGIPLTDLDDYVHWIVTQDNGALPDAIDKTKRWTVTPTSLIETERLSRYFNYKRGWTGDRPVSPELRGIQWVN